MHQLSFFLRLIIHNILELHSTILLDEVLEGVPVLLRHRLGDHGDCGDGSRGEGIQVHLVGVWEWSVGFAGQDHAGDVGQSQSGHYLGRVIAAGECWRLRTHKPTEARTPIDPLCQSQYFAQTHRILSLLKVKYCSFPSS